MYKGKLEHGMMWKKQKNSILKAINLWLSSLIVIDSLRGKRESSFGAKLLAELCQHIECVCSLLSDSLVVNQILLLWVALYSRHPHTHIHSPTKTHVGVQTVAHRPRPPLAGPSAYALLITSPFIPKAVRVLSELQNNRNALNCTVTGHAFSLASSAIFQYWC